MPSRVCILCSLAVSFLFNGFDPVLIDEIVKVESETLVDDFWNDSRIGFKQAGHTGEW